MRLAASMGNMPKGLLSLLFDDNASLVTGCTDLLLVELAGAPQTRGSECDCPPPMAACIGGMSKGLLPLLFDNNTSLVTG